MDNLQEDLLRINREQEMRDAPPLEVDPALARLTAEWELQNKMDTLFFAQMTADNYPVRAGVRWTSSLQPPAIYDCPYCDTENITPVKSAMPGGMDSCPCCGGYL